jgi:2,5-diamino-6-(ribosylamino)-4(3H)-pyrimidinone 5'-phosphate reductase
MLERAETTLCLVISLDGKITTGSTDNLDSDLDWKRVVGVKEGFSQYYKVEQSLGPNYLNSGRVLEKVGFNNKREVPQKEPLKFIVVGRKPHLNKSGIDYLCKWLEKLFIVTNNPSHPAFEMKKEHKNLEMVYYETEIDFADLLVRMRKNYKIEKITIESGGTLNSVFFRNGLVDHAKIVVAPLIVGGRGITLKAKAITLFLLWITICYSAFFIVNMIALQIVMLVIAGGVTIHILTLPTCGKPPV